MKTITRLLVLSLLTIGFLSTAAMAAAPKQPNVIIIFIDDMGYGDVGFNGAKGPKTPNLDKMGADGMIFSDFYVGCAVCSGSRTSLMTGCHYQRLSMSAVLFPNSGKGLNPDEVTIADVAGWSQTYLDLALLAYWVTLSVSLIIFLVVIILLLTDTL